MREQDFEQQLPFVLHRATIGLPRNTHRYEQLERRRHRRTVRVLGGLAAAACLALAIGGTYPISPDQPTRLAQDANSVETAESVERPAPGCPTAAARIAKQSERFEPDKPYRTARLCDPTDPNALIVLDSAETKLLLRKLRATVGCETSARYGLLFEGPGLLPAYLRIDDCELVTYVESLAH
jgi:hypothetical protein